MTRDEQEIRQIPVTWMAATKAGDAETLAALMSDEAAFLVTGKAVMRKEDFVTAVRGLTGQQIPQIEGKSEIQEVQITGDWAYMWSDLTVVVTPPFGRQPITRKGPVLTVLRKQNGKWVIWRDANMLSTIEE